MTAYTRLFIDQGATFNKVIYLDNEVTNADVNVAGYTVTSQLRRSYYAANASANIVCTVTDAPNGEITMSMTAANTANIRHGRYFFDVKTVDSEGTVDRLLEGIAIVTPQITK